MYLNLRTPIKTPSSSSLSRVICLIGAIFDLEKTRYMPTEPPKLTLVAYALAKASVKQKSHACSLLIYLGIFILGMVAKSYIISDHHVFSLSESSSSQSHFFCHSVCNSSLACRVAAENKRNGS